MRKNFTDLDQVLAAGIPRELVNRCSHMSSPAEIIAVWTGDAPAKLSPTLTVTETATPRVATGSLNQPWLAWFEKESRGLPHEHNRPVLLLSLCCEATRSRAVLELIAGIRRHAPQAPVVAVLDDGILQGDDLQYQLLLEPATIAVLSGQYAVRWPATLTLFQQIAGFWPRRHRR